GYPLTERTRVIVCTHAQLGRRGFSTYMRNLWNCLGPDERHPDRPRFAVLIDEAPEFLGSARQEFDLHHRAARRGEPDGSGGYHVPLERCPKFTRSGNCGNCRLVGHGGVPKYNAYGIRELRRPPAVEFDAEGHRLRQPRSPLTAFADLRLGPKVRV